MIRPESTAVQTEAEDPPEPPDPEIADEVRLADAETEAEEEESSGLWTEIKGPAKVAPRSDKGWWDWSGWLGWKG